MVQLNPSDRNHPTYPQDVITVTKASHTYNGTISHVNSEVNTSTRYVDGAVEVKSVPEETRKAMLSLFTSSQTKIQEAQMGARLSRGIGIAVTVIGCLTAIGAGISQHNALISANTAGVLYASSLGAAVAGIIGIVQNSKLLGSLTNDFKENAVSQAAWADPIDKVVAQRQNTGKKGFSYVFSKNLKDVTVHPKEVEQLWIDGLGKLLGKQQEDLSAFKENLFGEKEIAYAWPENYIPNLEIGQKTISGPTLNAMAAKYRDCHANYQVFDSLINQQELELQRALESTRQWIESQRAQAMQPALHMYNNGLQEAKHLYDYACQAYQVAHDNKIHTVENAYSYTIYNPEDPEEVSHKRRLDSMRNDTMKEIESEYNQALSRLLMRYNNDVAQCEFLYKQTKYLVKTFFEPHFTKLDTEGQNALESIQSQHSEGENEFIHSLNQIILKRSPFDFQDMDLPTPVVIKKWNLSDFSNIPSWNTMYETIPQYQRSYATKVSQSAWDMFWGAQGFRKYAYKNCDWSKRAYDHTRFPLRKGWFSLDNEHIANNSFRQPVIVPPAPLRKARVPQQQPAFKPQPTASSSRSTPSQPNGMGLNQKSVSFGTTTRRPEKRNDTPPNSQGVNTNSRTAVGTGGTIRREETKNDTPPNSQGANTNSKTAIGTGGTIRR